jgi:site-specific DNA-methyltransferase (adenine-specific)
MNTSADIEQVTADKSCPFSLTYCEDCVEAMKRYPDNYFSLAICDPPYGLPKDSSHRRGKLKNRMFNNGDIDQWDKKPEPDFFSELFRVSRNQIIWGGNYFGLPPTRGFVIWDKEQPFKNFSAAEYAWTSFQTVSKIFRLAATRTGDEIKIHPTQKPVKLYEFLLHDFAVKGDVILDTHLGSGSSRIAAYKHGFDFVGFEIAQKYFDLQEKRFSNFTSQMQIF